MEQKDYRFLNYKTHDAFLQDFTDDKISNDSIVFIQDRHCIWARGTEYVCKGENQAFITPSGISIRNSDGLEVLKVSVENGMLSFKDSNGLVYNTPIVQDISNNVTRDEMNNAISLIDIPVIPRNVSAFTNDAGYLTEHLDISGKADITSVYTKLEVNDLLLENSDTPIALEDYAKVEDLVSKADNSALELLESRVSTLEENPNGTSITVVSGSDFDLLEENGEIELNKCYFIYK